MPASRRLGPALLKMVVEVRAIEERVAPAGIQGAFRAAGRRIASQYLTLAQAGCCTISAVPAQRITRVARVARAIAR